MRTKSIMLAMLAACVSLCGCSSIMRALDYTSGASAEQQTTTIGGTGDSGERNGGGDNTHAAAVPASVPVVQAPQLPTAPQAASVDQPIDQAKQVRLQKEQAVVEQATGFFTVLATMLPPPWNLLAPAAVGAGASWWGARRRYKVKKQ